MNIKYPIEYIEVNISVFVFSNLFYGIEIMACQKLPDILSTASREPPMLICYYSCFSCSSVKKSIVNSMVFKTSDSRTRLSGFEAQLCRLLAVGPWASDFPLCVSVSWWYQ